MRRRRFLCAASLIAVLVGTRLALAEPESIPTDDPTAGAPGAPAERIEVTQSSGEATLEIPIDVPRGTGGFQPTLVLRYSSLGADSIFGVGWRLALGEIHRSDRFGTPSFGPSDPFELDGELLVANASGTEYRTQTEKFARIQPDGDQWEVTFANGTIARFGTTEEGRIRRFADLTPGAGDGPIARWLLEELEDPNGNEIHFAYDRATDPGTAHPTEISYTQRGGTPVGVLRKVVFDYDPTPRPDPAISFRGGVRSELSRRVTAIRSLVGAQVFRTRTFTYDDTGYGSSRTRLTATTLFGEGCAVTSPPAAGCAMPTQVLDYRDPSDTITSAESAQWPATSAWTLPVDFAGSDSLTGRYGIDHGVRFGDVDGDGRPDLLRADKNVREVYRNTGAGWALDPTWTQRLQAVQFTGKQIGGSGGQASGCGISDLPNTPIEFAHFPDYLSTEDWSGGTKAAPQSAQVVDLNDDGLVDLLVAVQAGPLSCATEGSVVPTVVPAQRLVEVWLNTGAGWTRDGEAEVLRSSLLASGAVFLVSGLEHAPGLAGAAASCYTIDINKSSSLRIVASGNASGGCVIGYSLPRGTVLADLNGDGRPDLLSSTGGSYPTLTGLAIPAVNGIWLNLPIGFEAHPELLTPFSWFALRALASGVPAETGARIVDVNGDGLADLVKTATPVAGVIGDADAALFGASGVWLNAGGAGAGGAAWCGPDDDGEPNDEDCPEAQVYLPPTAAPFAVVRDSKVTDPIFATEPHYVGGSAVQLLDLNGDGLVDLLRNDGAPACDSATMRAWVQARAPGTTPAAAWVEDPRFAPPASLCGLGEVFPEAQVGEFTFDRGVRVLDADANGTPDFLRASQGQNRLARLSASTFVDRLASYANGRGGVHRFEYVSAPVQATNSPPFTYYCPPATANLEQQAYCDAQGDPATPGKEPGDLGIVRWSTRPVVSELTIEGGVGSGPYFTTYSYARPIWNPARRSSQGFRAVQARRPDLSLETTFFWQAPGRAGQRSRREIAAGDGALLSREEWDWVVVAGAGVTGSLPGVDVGRLVAERRQNRYGGSLGQLGGARRSVSYSYDDATGYNFVSQVLITRPTGSITVTRAPEPADLDRWIVGRIDTETHTSGGITYRSIDLDYVPGRGLIALVRRGVGPRAPGAPLAIASTFRSYDGYGNPTSVTDAEGRTTFYCYDGDSNFAGTGVGCPGAGTETHSVLAGIRDPIGGVTAVTADLASGDLRSVVRFNGDRATVVPDAFGRPVELSVHPDGYSATLLETRGYQDAPLSPVGRTFIERFEETGSGSAIRSATYFDGLGREVRSVYKTPSGYAGTARFYDYAGRPVQERYPTDCDSDEHCLGLDAPLGGSPLPGNPVTLSEYDALGRLVRRRAPSPLGSNLPYAVTLLAYELGAWPETDDVWLKQPSGSLTVRSFDGDRLVSAAECPSILPDVEDPYVLGQFGCNQPGGITSYAYEPTGEVSAITDAVATATGQFANPRHRLVYEYDTLGRTTRVIDPDGGTSTTTYDLVGNVESVTNARGQQSFYGYDALDRLVSADLPDTDPANDVTVTYDPETRLPDRETRPGYYWVDRDYDAFGRERRRAQNTAGMTMLMDFEYDLLGRPTKIVYPSPNTEVTYGYQGAYLTQVCGRASLADCVASPADSLIQGVVYDELGRVRDVLEPPGTQRFAYHAPSYSLESIQYLQGASAAQHLRYAYDGSDNVTEIEDLVAGVTSTYGYDERERLAQFARGGIAKFFNYDSIGNLILRDGAQQTAPPNQLYAHPDKPHAITQGANGLAYAYDADGNVKQRGGQHLTYDAQNRLLCVGSAPGACNHAKFGYTLDGTRYWDTRSSSTPGIVVGDWFQWDTPTQTATTHIYAFGREIAYRVSHNASLRGAEILPAWWLPIGPKPLAWALGLLAGSGVLLLAVRAGVPRHLAERPATAALSLAVAITLLPNPAWAGGPPIFGNGMNTWVPRWVVHDHLGTGELILDASGGLVQQRTFDPWGKILSQSAPTEPSPRLFTGQRFQDGAGLYDFKARWYDADVGRFLSVDPILQSLGDPQTHNAYGYVRNNPVNSTDPDGRCETLCVIGIIIYVAIVGYSTYSTVQSINSWVSDPSTAASAAGNPSGLSQLVPEAILAAEGTARIAVTAGYAVPGRSTPTSAADFPETVAIGAAGQGILRAPIPWWAKLVALTAVTLYAVAQILMQEGSDPPPLQASPDQSPPRSVSDPESLRGATPEEVETAAKEAGFTERIDPPRNDPNGARLRKPGNPADQVRIQSGNPADPNPVKRGPYVRVSQGRQVSEPIPLAGNPTLP